jgi:hypothetical protein
MGAARVSSPKTVTDDEAYRYVAQTRQETVDRRM